MGPCQGSGQGRGGCVTCTDGTVRGQIGRDGTWTEGMGRYVDGGDRTHILRGLRSQWRPSIFCGASHEMTPTRNGLWNGCGTPPRSQWPNPTLPLYPNTATFWCCTHGGTFASKHSCNEIVLRRVQGGSNFVVIPFERNALGVSMFFKDVSSVGVPL